jgi:hypothetical protein
MIRYIRSDLSGLMINPSSLERDRIGSDWFIWRTRIDLNLLYNNNKIKITIHECNNSNWFLMKIIKYTSWFPFGAYCCIFAQTIWFLSYNLLMSFHPCPHTFTHRNYSLFFLTRHQTPNPMRISLSQSYPTYTPSFSFEYTSSLQFNNGVSPLLVVLLNKTPPSVIVYYWFLLKLCTSFQESSIE